MKLLPSRCTFCVHHTTMHQFTVSLHLKPCMLGACVFSCNLPLALLAEWVGSFMCYCGNVGWNGYWNRSQRWKFTLEKKICHSCWDLNPWPFDPKSSVVPLSYPCSPVHTKISAYVSSISQSESFVLSCVKRKSFSFVTKSCMIGVRLYEIDPYLRECVVGFPRVRALRPVSSYACGMMVWGRECLLFWMAVHDEEVVRCKSLKCIKMQHYCIEGVCIVYFPWRNTGHFCLLSLCDVEQLPLQSVCKEPTPLSCCWPFKTMKTARLVYVRYRQTSVMMVLVGIWADHVSRECLHILILTYLVQRRDWRWRSCNSLFTWCKDEMEDQIW